MFGEMSVNRLEVVVPHGALCTQDLFVSAMSPHMSGADKEGWGREEGRACIFWEQEM